MPDLTTPKSPYEVKRLIWDLVRGIAGKTAAYNVLADGIKLRVGLVALKLVRAAYRAKAQHGAGDDGIQWAELSPQTIANRRLGDLDIDNLKDLGITKRKYGYGMRANGGELDVTGRLMRPFLTEAQNKRWKMLFARKKAWLMGMFGMDEGAAAGQAAAIAWTTLKSEGALTKLQVLGTRHVMIGLDTGRLYSSLGPGMEHPEHFPIDGAQPPDPPAPASPDDRILRLEPGAVVVGTNVEYAERFAQKRPLWPDELPSAWQTELIEVCGEAVGEAILLIAQQDLAA